MKTLRRFQMELAANPESGDLIRLSGGLRKARMKLPAPAEVRARGRSTVVVEHATLRLFMLYTKARQTDIPPATLARLRMAVETIKARYNR